MSKFFGSCSKSLDDIVPFCTNCGVTQAVQQVQQNQQFQKNQQSNFSGATNKSFMDNIKNITKNLNQQKFIGLGAIALVFILFFVIILTSLSNAYKKPINKMIKAFEKNNTEIYMQLYPDFVSEYCEDTKLEYYDFYNIEEYYQDELNTICDSLYETYGDNIKIEYEILNKTKFSKSELKTLANDYEENYDSKNVEITNGYEIRLALTLKGDNKQETKKSTFNIIKVNGSWYIDSLFSSLNALFNT